ncbi:phage tail assembly protein [Vibrio gazogenes]|uniref:Mu-like prophage FluMu protein gp41 n=1 Tax=Vibrio gazogenes DSM 21264 = NBRC 103151 TaxID=1123492 RepID=A0A1M5FBJ7_VIBGA|nr:phage tail assembly protein [Vibrio gazogenes]USP15474.1 phage tail assembly protein [Vibrio gazogenes]SHF88472.1 Mu-like prophage FluMu protein gp41 [Vibrio gazogenes DSM 21264] [Vibrio gazogenes DSM 21264 = NBRC 103151]SJN54552.1 Mu-like prophage FluMu protein gp41 [Vibrio gazogenes]
MAALMTFELTHGYKVGEVTHLEVGLRELNSGDYIDAQMASEKVVVVNGEAVAYTSNVLYGLELLCRQVEFIGKVNGPLEEKDLRKLHQDDFALLQEKAKELDEMIVKELEQRGRS